MRPSLPQRLTRHGLILIAGVAAAVGCTNDGGTGPAEPPPPATVRFAVTFATTPLALASIAVTLTSAGLPTVTLDLTPVPGTDSRQWTGGPVSIRAGTYAVDIQGTDASDVVTYRGSGTLTIQNGQSRTFAFALVCVSSACQGLGTLTLFVLTPELEVEPNDASSAATPLGIASLFGGQLEMGAANGTINPGSDLDYFSLPFSAVAPGDTIVVQLYGSRFGSPLNAVVALFDPLGAQLIEVDDSPVGTDPIIMITMPFAESAGTYQVRVSSSGGSSTGQYTMWAYHCRSGGANSVSCRDPSGSPALSGAAALTLTGAGTGSGQVVSSPAGIDCTIARGTAGATGCSGTVNGGTGVTLSVTLWTGSTVTAWSGTGSSCSGISCQVTMDQARAVTVTLGGRAGDLNGDGLVDAVDLSILLSNWGRTDKPPADINRDGFVDDIDQSILLGNWTGGALTTVTGSVIDGSTGSGIEGAVAHFSSNGVQVAQVTTGTNGSYETALSPGTYDVSAEASGYVGVTLYNASVSGTTTVIEPLVLVPTSPSPGGISGSIVDARTGVGISGATVELRPGMNAVSGAPLATTSSDALGQYEFSSLPANTYTVLVNATGYTTAVRTGIVVGGSAVSGQNVALSSVGSSTELRIVLTWGAQPSDLDSHLTGPTADGGRFHVYWIDRGSLTGAPWAALDHDDVTSYGPETITIVQQLSGVYRYSVHDYSDRFTTPSTALATSGARVDLYRGSSLITSFFPPPQDGTLWTVFELQGEQVTSINTMTYESNPTIVQAPPVTVGRFGNDAMVIQAGVTAHPKP
ncbi:MAG TPA: carboxypeptidase regulatory-like domain-containing protein [Gemmatimonadales bacterium]|jgi:hypothetical protein